MTVPHKVYSVRLDRGRVERLESHAQALGLSSSEVVRNAIDLFFARAELLGVSQRRIARLTEFTHLGVDVILREQYPEFRDRIVAETDRRLEQHHGAR